MPASAFLLARSASCVPSVELLGLLWVSPCGCLSDVQTTRAPCFRNYYAAPFELYYVRDSDLLVFRPPRGPREISLPSHIPPGFNEVEVEHPRVKNP